MSYHVTTPLGREVPLGDWKALHADTMLRSLYGFETSGFNVQHNALGIDALCNVTGLEPPDVQELGEELAADGMVTPEGAGKYRITSKGLAHVATLKALMAATAPR